MQKPQEILLAEPRGFCAGVDRAIEIVERALQKFGRPIYVRHEIVHNTYVVNDLKDHPVPEMLRQGLHVTLNSDDPAYFGGYVNDNYRELAHATGLTRAQLTRLARNSFEGSFLSEADKAKRIAEVEAYAAAQA